VPDLEFHVEAQREEHGTVTVCWLADGHHTGFGLGRSPSGASVKLRGVLAADFSSDNVCHIHGTWDIAGYLVQIGACNGTFRRALTIAGDEIRLRSVPGGQGLPMLLFPAMTLPGWMTWKRFIKAIRGRRPVITFQLIANRLALAGGRVPRGYCVSRETRAIVHALEAARIKGPFHIVGHSAGGTFALDFALENENQVRSVTLIEPALAWVLKAEGRLKGELKAFLNNRMAAYSKELTEEEYASLLQKMMNREGYDPRKSLHWPLLYAYRHNVKFRPFLYTHSDSLRRVQSARFPVMLVGGTESDPFHREVIRVLQSNLHNCRTVMLPGGHAPHYWEGMETFLRHLNRFHRASESRLGWTCQARE
jgi:pimeloyl-ACP methyl ester carboxylesterase